MEINSTNQQAGASYVEMALSLLVFMLIIISVIELLRFSFVTVSLQHVLQEGLEAATKSNFTETGGCQMPNSGVVDVSLRNVGTRASCIKQEIIQLGSKFGLIILPEEISVTPQEAPGVPRCQSPNINNAGEKSTIVSICIRQELPLFLWIPKDIFMEFLVFGRNETFRYSDEV
jgi:hypothetical protein